MKKNFSILLLIVIILPVTILFSGCSNNDRELSVFMTEYNDFLQDNTDYVTVINMNDTADSNDYLNDFTLNYNAEFASAISIDFSYSFSQNYLAVMYDSAIDVIRSYMPAISKSNNISTSDVDNIYADYDVLIDNLSNLFGAMSDLNLSFEFTSSKDELPNLARLELFIEAYINTVEAANSLADNVITVYNDNILAAKTAVYSDNFTNDADMIELYAYIKLYAYQAKAMVNNVFFQTTLQDNNIAENIVNKTYPYDSDTNFKGLLGFDALDDFVYVDYNNNNNFDSTEMYSNREVIINIYNALIIVEDIIYIDYDYFKSCVSTINYSEMADDEITKYDYNDIENYNFVNYFYYGNFTNFTGAVSSLLAYC